MLLASVAAVAAVAVAGSSWFAATRSSPAEPPSSSTMSELLRTNGEVLSKALNEATARADRAVTERERTAAQLDQCHKDLQQRDDYLKAAAPEVRRLKEELDQAKEALVRVEAYFGAAAVLEAQRHRGWLTRALAMGADAWGSADALVRRD